MKNIFDALRRGLYTEKRIAHAKSLDLENRIIRNAAPFQEEEEMAKRIRREVVVNGIKHWITGNTEQEYAERLMKVVALEKSKEVSGQRHNFGLYSENWFNTYSEPNIETSTAQTYKRQLSLHILPFLGNRDIEDITPDDIQSLYNRMNGTKATKIKTKTVLNMIFSMAVDDDIILKNPVKSNHVRITGIASQHSKEYSLEQMRYLIRSLPKIQNPTDRRYLTLQALHPLRLEEVLGLKWEDADWERMQLHVRRAVTHPTRNMPEIKAPKTESSIRNVGLLTQERTMLGDGEPDEFIIGGKKPFSYTQVRRMCERIQRDTQFEEKVTPVRFRTTVLTDIYSQTKDIKQAQEAAGHTTAAMTLKYYVKGRGNTNDTASAIEHAYEVAN